MGLFKKMKDTMAEAQDAITHGSEMQRAGEESMRQAQASGMMGGVNMGNAAQMTQQGLADRGSIEAQAKEQNRILGIGSPGTATIKGHVDTGEQVAGNPVWMLDVEITPEGGAPYSVQKREIISAAAMGGYADGTTMPCRIDPADPNTFAFGEKPFM